MTKRFPTDPEILENDTFNVNDDVNKFMRMEFDNKVVSAGTCPKYQRKKGTRYSKPICQVANECSVVR